MVFARMVLYHSKKSVVWDKFCATMRSSKMGQIPVQYTISVQLTKIIGSVLYQNIQTIFKIKYWQY